MRTVLIFKALFLDNQGATPTAKSSYLTGFRANRINAFLREVSFETSPALLQLMNLWFSFLVRGLFNITLLLWVLVDVVIYEASILEAFEVSYFSFD